jgi:hypothetical protein
MATEPGITLRSFKLQRHERHLRIVPATGPDGCPFGGPGVDVSDDEADTILALAAPLFAAIEGLEPGVQIRSLSVDLTRPRLLVTLVDRLSTLQKPRVLRIDEISLIERLLGRSGPLLAALSRAAEAALARR